jgi:tetratricopeptide (TPR) repeat protein
LIECCWEGRIVGEDAINRVIARLRQLAAAIGADSFQVETIRGVGYRLVERGASADPVLTSRLPRRWVLAASGAVVAAAAAGVWIVGREPAHQPSNQALEYYRRGIETRGQASLELSERGAALFREATRIDPQFADAWGALAWTYRGLLEYGPRPDSARLHALSRAAAARALELDKDNVEAQAALLLLKPFYGNWQEIEEGCRRLLRRHPGNSIVEYNLGCTLVQVGRWRDGIPWLRAVSERERFWPLPHIILVQALLSIGKVQEAEDLIEDGMRRFPKRKDYWQHKVRYLTLSGRLPEALAFANDAMNRPSYGAEPVIDFETMVVETLAHGSAAERTTALRKVTESARKVPAFLPTAITTAAILGDLDTSFAMFDGYFFGRGPWAAGRQERALTSFLFIPSTKALRKDLRFARLLHETGLERYWEHTGSIPDFRRA